MRSRVWFALLPCLLGTMRAESFQFTTLVTPGLPGQINNLGQIVIATGILDVSGGFTPIRVPGSQASALADVNDAGVAVGAFETADLFARQIGSLAFLFNSGTFSPIDPIGNAPPPPFSAGLYALANGVNDAGQVVGTYSAAFKSERGFLYSNGTITPIDFAGTLVEFRDINNRGQILVLADQAMYLYSGGTFVAVPFLLSAQPGSLAPAAINDSGDIVGSFDDPASGANVRRAFLYSGGAFQTIDYPGASGTTATGINNSGEIVGWYTDSAGQARAFSATPVPEPASAWLFCFALITASAGTILRRPLCRECVPGWLSSRWRAFQKRPM